MATKEYKCKKIRYETVGEALAALRKFKSLKKYMPDLKHRHYYWCKHCKCFHLTSEEQYKRKK